MLKEGFCVLHMPNELFFFIFDQLYLVTDVSYGDGKGVIFLSFFSLSCGVNNFGLEELFSLTIFTL